MKLYLQNIKENFDLAETHCSVERESTKNEKITINQWCIIINKGWKVKIGLFQSNYKNGMNSDANSGIIGVTDEALCLKWSLSPLERVENV